MAMKRFPLLLCLLLSSGSLFAADHARYIVGLRHAPQRLGLATRIASDAREREERSVRDLSSMEAYAANLTETEAAELRASSDVRYVNPVISRYMLEGTPRPASSTPLDSPYVSRQVVPYGIDMIHARDVWPVTRGGGGAINVVVVDTGIDYRHSDLTASYTGGYNTYSLTNDPLDDNDHGTHVSGIIAAVDNNIGVVGVAPQVKLWAVKVLDKSGFSDNEHIVTGIDWVIAKKKEVGGNWIMNFSLGDNHSSDAEADAYRRAIGEGILVIAAAGNRAFPVLDYPAAYPGVVAVGAIDETKTIASFSNTGPTLSLSAPGVNVLSTVPLGTATVSDVQTNDGAIFVASPFKGSPKLDQLGKLIYCNLGQPGDFPSTVAGNVALIRRGDIQFNEKVRNALAAGAIAVVVYNRVDGPNDIDKWTLISVVCDSADCHEDPKDLNEKWPLTLGVTYAAGQELLKRVDGATVASYRSDDYARFNGTSMATPHVVGAAALVWSLVPTATAAQVRAALETTAHDLGDTGVDPTYGHGLVDAFAAAKLLASQRFVRLPPRPSPQPVTDPW
jgi:subtilisin family serine protease